MGRYIEWDDVVNRYGDVARMGDATRVGSHHIAFAEDELDARLSAGGYTVPFSTAPGVVRDLAIDMTYWRMTMRAKGSEAIKEFIDERVEGIINGTIALSVNGTAIDAGSVAWAEHDKAGYHSVFGADDPENWSPSDDQMSDSQDARE